MASVYKCDRCGKEMDYKRNAWRLRTKIKYARILLGDDSMQHHYYDLCGDCGKALLKWMEGKNHDA